MTTACARRACKAVAALLAWHGSGQRAGCRLRHRTCCRVLPCVACSHPNLAAATGDVVAIELLPESQWKSSSRVLPAAAAAAAAAAGGGVDDSPPGSPGAAGGAGEAADGEAPVEIFGVRALRLSTGQQRCKCAATQPCMHSANAVDASAVVSHNMTTTQHTTHDAGENTQGPEAAEPSDAVSDSSSRAAGAGGSSSTARPTGRVVGITKRNWRTRCVPACVCLSLSLSVCVCVCRRVCGCVCL
jgi:hypothetical protein